MPSSASSSNIKIPRPGLSTSDVVAAAAQLADESGIGAVTLVAVSARLGVKPPALYNHVVSIGDLHHLVATLAISGLGEALRDALQGKSRKDAIEALFMTLRSYLSVHAGRYEATTRANMQGPDNPLLTARTRVTDSVRAVLSGYGIQPDELEHAIRALRRIMHGYALLQVDAAKWGNDSDESVAWMVRFVDAGLRDAARSSVKDSALD